MNKQKQSPPINHRTMSIRKVTYKELAQLKLDLEYKDFSSLITDLVRYYLQRTKRRVTIESNNINNQKGGIKK